MDLETPTEAVCPLCMDETVEIGENKNERPYFNCETFNSVVNLRPSTVDAWEQLEMYAQADSPAELAQLRAASESGESDDETVEQDDEPETLGDILGGSDE